MSILKKLFNIETDESVRLIGEMQPIISQINAFEESISKLSDEELKGKTVEFKKQLEEGKTLDDILPEAYASVREASKRVLGQRHYDVQLIGGITMHRKSIAEMRTGEGKTLVATLPIYLNALPGKGVHLVTVNDYLSRRDAVWMGQIYSFLGLTCSVINQQASFMYDPSHMEKDEERDELGSFKVIHEFLNPCTRKEAYLADITYGTNSEFGFDYLRDNIAYTEERLVQRGYNFAVVDEIDSILIDEARTPLIISAPAEDAENLYHTFAKIAKNLVEVDDYTVDEKTKSVEMTESGISKAEKALGVDNIYTERGIKYVHHLHVAVRAKALFFNNKQYVVKDGEIVIVDEFTGRMQPGRRWSEGLHQGMEAKEGLSVQQESRTFASITYQNYFRMYNKLAGMTGTAVTSKEEFFEVYELDVVTIPTNLPVQRDDKNDLIFQSEIGKFKAIARIVKELHDKGQPVLIGTVSIEKNELLSTFLKKEGVPHEVLNAKKHEQEGTVIAQAGKKARVTVATNMAGRGVDIKLGGLPENQEAYEEVKALGGLFVLGTERHEARRIDNQLRGRAGRQGDPGGTQFFVSFEDELMRVFGGDKIKNLVGKMAGGEDQPVEHKWISKQLESAQTKIEGFHYDARKHVLAYDNVLNAQRQYIYELRTKILTGAYDEVQAILDGMVGGDKEAQKAIDNKEKEMGEEVYRKTLRQLMLQTIDMMWMDHLEVMDYMRNSVNLRAYGQRDPLIEYKKEGLRQFNDLKESIGEKVVEIIPNMNAGAMSEEAKRAQEAQKKAQLISGAISRTLKEGERKVEGESANKVGRNDPCPCGSGKKYKKCCG